MWQQINGGRRMLPRQVRLDLHGTWMPKPKEYVDARAAIAASGVVGPITKRLDRSSAARARLNVEGYLLGLQVNGNKQRHQAYLLEVTRAINSMSPDLHVSLGMPNWP